MRAVVVGGSIAGLSAARALWRSGIETLVLERSDGALRDRGAGLGFDPSLVAAVLGHDPDPELPQLRPRGRALHRGGADAPEIEAGEHRLTTWQHLYAALRHGLEVAVSTGVQVCGLRPHGSRWEVLTRQSEVHRADLVVGADGHRSALRRHVDPSAQPRYSGYLLWRGMVAADALDDEVRATFLDGHLHLRPAPRQHFVCYEVPAATVNGPQRLNWGWYSTAFRCAPGGSRALETGCGRLTRSASSTGRSTQPCSSGSRWHSGWPVGRQPSSRWPRSVHRTGRWAAPSHVAR